MWLPHVGRIVETSYIIAPTGHPSGTWKITERVSAWEDVPAESGDLLAAEDDTEWVVGFASSEAQARELVARAVHAAKVVEQTLQMVLERAS